jgi:hypothetical protein
VRPTLRASLCALAAADGTSQGGLPVAWGCRGLLWSSGFEGARIGGMGCSGIDYGVSRLSCVDRVGYALAVLMPRVDRVGLRVFWSCSHFLSTSQPGWRCC